MNIYFAEVSLDEGYQVLEEGKESRLVRGRKVSRPAGWSLFHQLKGQPIRCHFCGCQADRWVAVKGRRDRVGPPVLELYATSASGGNVLMTRDHIIPKSLGGKDCVENLRSACQPCNEQRSNDVSPDIIEFARQHPELIDEARVKKGLEGLQNHIERLKTSINNQQDEIARLRQPFIDMGYL